MPKYHVQIEEPAEQQLRRLPGHVRQRARNLIRSLGNDPRPRGAKELRGYPDYYRIHLEKWRVVYHIEDDVLIVVIIGVPFKEGPQTYEKLMGGR